ncbi:uncharacterized protein B0H18DRAFT_484199 [Fomitopsis serialis]|uniref:uncharacterized protein n=1 Tax=Fomitopsis serialis TaxID=139415 RepID=UPI002008971C|nr:uncharacterized protein B0H18DRAFT_484199 [Neoantrodia serialis]KAH9934683.1 hypothetical protein B0H18DRAFT_484199 [Neoantrodia serialis]
MHHARRAVHIKRPLVRAASAAVQPAPKPLGKWARPEPGPSSQNYDASTTASSSRPPVPRARHGANNNHSPEMTTLKNLNDTSGSAPQARAWARRITPAESQGNKTNLPSPIRVSGMRFHIWR